ncbi:MAG: BrxA/BrxB family bacilliredoxin [Planctomycetes bacterium]|nr:BrxA/BrxB family bacilliredoxin [Planctomycetota bacterium]
MYQQFPPRRPLCDLFSVQPLRDELVKVGICELRTPEQVDDVLGSREGTVLIVINSVCGCASASARPGVMLALQNHVIPDRMASVFAGQDSEAMERLSSVYLEGLPPSSPSIVLFQDGRVETLLDRHNIEGLTAREIAGILVEAFNRCAKRPGPSIAPEELRQIVTQPSGVRPPRGPEEAVF